MEATGCTSAADSVRLLGIGRIPAQLLLRAAEAGEYLDLNESWHLPCLPPPTGYSHRMKCITMTNKPAIISIALSVAILVLIVINFAVQP